VEAEQTILFEQGKHTTEYRFRKKDGSYCWVSDEQHLIKDAHGQPSEIVGSWSDITGRKQAEASEDAARARLSALLESAPAVIYSFKASGDYAPTFVSENIKRLLGYCPEKISRACRFLAQQRPSRGSCQRGSRPSEAVREGAPHRRVPLPSQERQLHLGERRAVSLARR
jgi:PAS domain-containing protein